MRMPLSIRLARFSVKGVPFSFWRLKQKIDHENERNVNALQTLSRFHLKKCIRTAGEGTSDQLRHIYHQIMWDQIYFDGLVKG